MNCRTVLREVLSSILDFLYPIACPLCNGTLSDDDILCPDCMNAITMCYLNYSSPKRIVPHIDEIVILLPYDTRCRTLIHSLKYHNIPVVGLVLGKMMGRKAVQLNSVPANALLVPVPLHPARLEERGYNQSECLAQGFASFTNLEIDGSVLVRTRKTGTQTALDVAQRESNVQGAFRYSGEHSLSGRPVILLDDVMTTGATVSECAHSLREGGAGSVTVCVAATPDIGDD